MDLNIISWGYFIESGSTNSTLMFSSTNTTSIRCGSCTISTSGSINVFITPIAHTCFSTRFTILVISFIISIHTDVTFSPFVISRTPNDVPTNRSIFLKYNSSSNIITSTNGVSETFSPVMIITGLC